MRIEKRRKKEGDKRVNMACREGVCPVLPDVQQLRESYSHTQISHWSSFRFVSVCVWCRSDLDFLSYVL